MRVGSGSILVNFFSRPFNIFAIIDLFFFRKILNVYNSKNTEPIELKFTHNIRVGPVRVLGNFLFAPVQYFRDHRPFSFSQNC